VDVGGGFLALCSLILLPWQGCTAYEFSAHTQSEHTTTRQRLECVRFIAAFAPHCLAHFPSSRPTTPPPKAVLKPPHSKRFALTNAFAMATTLNRHCAAAHPTTAD
jgi:hypothetical protein